MGHMHSADGRGVGVGIQKAGSDGEAYINSCANKRVTQQSSVQGELVGDCTERHQLETMPKRNAWLRLTS